MQNIVVIVQARMGSERFPGKVLKKISDVSLIEWVIRRVKKSRKIKKIILATTKNKKDDVLKKIAIKNKVSIFRGESRDVLGRFYEAAKFSQCDVIIRVCADNPFIDFEQIDLLIKKFQSNNYDYVCNHQNRLNSNYADGFGAEIFSFLVLEELYCKAKKKSKREHVTKYIWDNIKKFKVLSVPAPDNLAYPKLKFDVNTLKDLKSINKLVKKNNISLTSKARDIVKFKLKEKKSKEKNIHGQNN